MADSKLVQLYRLIRDSGKNPISLDEIVGLCEEAGWDMPDRHCFHRYVERLKRVDLLYARAGIRGLYFLGE